MLLFMRRLLESTALRVESRAPFSILRLIQAQENGSSKVCHGNNELELDGGYISLAVTELVADEKPARCRLRVIKLLAFARHRYGVQLSMRLAVA